jgi:hypothetical protein
MYNTQTFTGRQLRRFHQWFFSIFHWSTISEHPKKDLSTGDKTFQNSPNSKKTAPKLKFSQNIFKQLGAKLSVPNGKLSSQCLPHCKPSPA